jgi:hypothetical protein
VYTVYSMADKWPRRTEKVVTVSTAQTVTAVLKNVAQCRVLIKRPVLYYIPLL